MWKTPRHTALDFPEVLQKTPIFGGFDRFWWIWGHFWSFGAIFWWVLPPLEGGHFLGIRLWNSSCHQMNHRMGLYAPYMFFFSLFVAQCNGPIIGSNRPLKRAFQGGHFLGIRLWNSSCHQIDILPFGGPLAVAMRFLWNRYTLYTRGVCFELFFFWKRTIPQIGK